MTKSKPLSKIERDFMAENTSKKQIDLSEELSLDQNIVDSGTIDDSINNMTGHQTDISSHLKPGMSNEEFINSIISIPDQELIPWGDCHLPSKGKYYGWDNGVVRVKAMNQKAEKVLTTQHLVSSGESIEYLFRECCKFPDGFDPADLILGDRVFLLYYLRGITHGNIYEFVLTCPNPTCGVVDTYTYDLNLLSSTIKYADDAIGYEPFKIVLPFLTKTTGREVFVHVRFLRTRDTYNMLHKQSFKKKTTAKPSVRTRGQDNRKNTPSNQQLDDTISDNLERVIVDVMGVSDPLVIREFVSRMHAMDTATIREWLKDNTPSMDSSIIITCPSCDHEFTAGLPISEGFFRPSKR